MNQPFTITVQDRNFTVIADTSSLRPLTNVDATGDLTVDQFAIVESQIRALADSPLGQLTFLALDPDVTTINFVIGNGTATNSFIPSAARPTTTFYPDIEISIQQSIFTDIGITGTVFLFDRITHEIQHHNPGIDQQVNNMRNALFNENPLLEAAYNSGQVDQTSFDLALEHLLVLWATEAITTDFAGNAIAPTPGAFFSLDLAAHGTDLSTLATESSVTRIVESTQGLHILLPSSGLQNHVSIGSPTATSFIVDFNASTFENLDLIIAGESPFGALHTVDTDVTLVDGDEFTFFLDEVAQSVQGSGPNGNFLSLPLSSSGNTGDTGENPGFAIDTVFVGALTEQPVLGLGDTINLVESGFVFFDQNVSVHSQTANLPGFFATPNHALGEFSPGRSAIVIESTGEVVTDLSSLLAAPLPEVDFGPSFELGAAQTGFGNTRFAAFDPLVLDLDDDGIELRSFRDGFIYFDVDNDGSLERTGWVGSDDGMLVHDLNDDGAINNITEALSEFYSAPLGTGAVFSNGFEALASLDTNADGAFTSADSAWSSLRIWRDANQNGATDSGELSTLDSEGITSISLSSTPDGSFTGGNEIRSNGTFERGASSSTIASINFIADPNGFDRVAEDSGFRITTEGDADFAFYSVGSTVGEDVDFSARTIMGATGNSGGDTLTGSVADDWLIGGLGSDSLFGGGGDDYIVADAADVTEDQAQISGGLGYDIVQFVGTDGVRFNLQRSDVEMVIGTAQADVFVSGSSDQVIMEGGAGSDLMIGGEGQDVLNGGEGADVLFGYNENDLLRGHRGADHLVGGGGNDVLFGGLGTDFLSGDAGQDVLRGDGGDDLIDGGLDYDIAQYSSSFADYLVSQSADGTWKVLDRRDGSPEGMDTLIDVEALTFSDVSEVSLVDTTAERPLPVKDRINANVEADGRTVRISIADLLANDLDYQGDALSITGVTSPVGGTSSIQGNEVVFVMDEDFSGVPSFSYTIEDEHGNLGRIVGVTGTTLTAEMTAEVTLKLDVHPDDPQFLDQWYLPEINVLPVWDDYTGAGVTIGVFEPGPWDAMTPGQIDYTHPDLLPNVDSEWLRTANPHIEPTTHATLVAGVIGAARNGEGGVGVAYNATLASEGFSQADPSVALTPLSEWKNFDIANNSWSFSAQLTSVSAAGINGDLSFVTDAVDNGRDGKGTIIVFGAGNERESGDDANAHSFSNIKEVVTVGAINAEGDLGNLVIAEAPFSNRGASILVSAPGSNITSTSRLLENDNGSTFGADYEVAKGTSFATPIVSGVVALMLEADPSLSWEDVQEILALSAKQIDDPNTEWSFNASKLWNGGGMHFSHDYGYGLVDARAAVRLAETWNDAERGAYQQLPSVSGTDLNFNIPDSVNDPLIITVSTNTAAPAKIQFVELELGFAHEQVGDLTIELISPSGTRSILLDRLSRTEQSGASDGGHGEFNGIWKFTSKHFLGENIIGNWEIKVQDHAAGNIGFVDIISFNVYGSYKNVIDTTAPDIVNSHYVYTDEYLTINDASRSTLADDVGDDVINTSAVTSSVVLDLRSGSQSSIADRTLNIANGTVIEDAFLGDGDDSVVGNAADNRLFGGRGDDTFDGGAGADEINGGAGYDTVSYAASAIGMTVDLTDGSNSLGEAAGDTYASIEHLEGSAHADVITGGQESVTISGEGGNDVLHAGSAAALLYGGDNDDILSGGGANDDLYGGAGNDTLDAGGGVDDLAGGAGNDTYRIDRTDGTARISSHQALGEGASTGDNDVVIFEDIGFDEIALTFDASGNRTLSWDDGVNSGSFVDFHGGQFIEDFQFADGTSFEEMRILVLETGAGAFTGGTGDDWIVSDGAAFSYLYGGQGDDIIDTSDGVVLVGGGAGDDTYRLFKNGGNITVSTNLTLSEDVATGTNDRFVFTDLNFADVSLSLVNYAETWGGRYKFDWDGGSLTSYYSSQYIEGYDFADGVSFDRVVLIDDLGTDDSANSSLKKFDGDGSSEWIVGRNGNEDIHAGDGDDYIDVSQDGGGIRNGGAGNDTIITGVDRDDVRGGDGDDIIVFSGNRIEYDISDDGTGVLTVSKVLGQGSGNPNDVVQEVETFRFDDGDYTLAEVLDTAPIATNDNFFTDEATAIFHDLLINDRALSGQTLSIVGAEAGGVSHQIGIAFDVLSEQGRTGAVLLASTGDLNFAFDPNGNFDPLEVGETDTVNLTYTISDGTSTDQADISVVVEGLSDGLSLIGTDEDDGLYGSSFDDTLEGRGGNDILDGRGSSDLMRGGTGDDRYYVDDAGDAVVEELDEGYDWIYVSIDYTLPDSVEAATFDTTNGLTVTGNSLDNWFSGGDGDDHIIGMDGRDRLIGYLGNDTLDGGLENDVLEGKEGADTFIFRAGDGTDRISDFDVNSGDLIRFEVAGLQYSDLMIFDTVHGAVVRYDDTDPANNQFTLTDLTAADLQASHFEFV